MTKERDAREHIPVRERKSQYTYTKVLGKA